MVACMSVSVCGLIYGNMVNSFPRDLVDDKMAMRTDNLSSSEFLRTMCRRQCAATSPTSGSSIHSVLSSGCSLSL